CGAFLALAIGWHWLGSSMRDNSVVIRMEQALRYGYPEKNVWAARFREPSLVFYGNRVWRMFEDESRLEQVLDNTPPDEYPAMILLQRKEVKLDRQLGEIVKSGLQSEAIARAPTPEETTASELAAQLQQLGYQSQRY